jgi:hypothetical protein
MGLARQAFNIDASWVNALPSWQSMYICRSQSVPAMADSSASRFGFVPRCWLGGWNVTIEPGTNGRRRDWRFRGVIPTIERKRMSMSGWARSRQRTTKMRRLVCDRWNPVTLLANPVEHAYPNPSNSRQVRAATYSSRIAVTGFRRIARCAGK